MCEIFLQVPKKKNYRQGFVEKLAQLCNKYFFSQESSDSRDTRKPAQRKFSENLKEHNDKGVEGKLLLTIFVHADSDFWTHPSHAGASVDICVSTEEYPALAKLLKENDIVLTS